MLAILTCVLESLALSMRFNADLVLLQALGNIAFAYSFSFILIEITVRSSIHLAFGIRVCLQSWAAPIH